MSSRSTLNKIHQICTIFRLLNYEQELTALSDWAERKRLTKVANAYANRLGDMQVRLFRHTACAPRLTYTMRTCFFIYRSLFPPPRHHRRGSAAKFRRDNLLSSTA